MANIPNKYLYKFLQNQLVDSAGTVISATELLPQITLGQKSTINIQLVNDDLTEYTGLAGGDVAQFMVDSDFINEAQPVPLGASGWTNSSGSEYRKYLSYEPSSVLFNLVPGAEGTIGTLADSEYAYDSVSNFIYVRLPGDADPAGEADNYVTAKFEVAGATPPFIECYSDNFNLAGSWYDTETETFRNPDVTAGELTFYINANTVNYYQRIASVNRRDCIGQMQFYSGGLNISIRAFTFVCNNKIYGAGESSTILELDGIGYYTKTEADSRFVLADVDASYPAASFATDGTFFFQSASGGSFALSAADLPGAASGEVNTASNLGTAGSGIFAGKVGVDLQFKSLLAGDNVTLTPSSTGITIASTGGGAAGVSTFNTATGDITLETTGAASLTQTGGSFALDVPDLQPDITQIKLDRVITQTGWIDAPLLSINGGDNTKFDISAGVGVVADWSDPSNPTFTEVTFAGATAQTVTYLATEYASGILISSAGEIVQNAGVAVPSQYRDYLFVGDLLHNNLTNLNGVQNKPVVQWDSIGGLRDLATAVGVINTSGNVYSANGTDLRIKKTSGTYYRAGINYESDPENPSTITNAAVTPITSYLRGYRDGSTGWTYDAQSAITPGVYDDGDGTPGTVPNNYFTIQRIYNFPGSNATIILIGQKTYSSLSAAITGIRDPFIVDPNIRDAALRGILIVKEDATNLSDTATAVFYEADKFGDVSGGSGVDGTDGIDGTSAYAYFAYASSATGSDFTLTPNLTSAYIAALATTTELPAPQAADFAGRWLKVKGEPGDKGDTGEQGPKGDKGDAGINGTDGIDGAKGDKGDPGADGINGVDGEPGTTLHNELTDVQGGTGGERYHLTLAELEKVQGVAGAATLGTDALALAGHLHDERYYTESEIDAMLATTGSAVISVNGYTGAITLGASDVGAATTDHTHTAYALTTHAHEGVYDASGAAATVQTNLETHTAATNPHAITAAGIGAANTAHNHDAAYAALSHNHDEDYATTTHNHDAAYAASSHAHANASTSGSGFLPQLPGGTTTFLRGDGCFATPPAGGGAIAECVVRAHLKGATAISLSGGAFRTVPLGDTVQIGYTISETIGSGLISVNDANQIVVSATGKYTISGWVWVAYSGAMHLCRNGAVIEGSQAIAYSTSATNPMPIEISLDLQAGDLLSIELHTTVSAMTLPVIKIAEVLAGYRTYLQLRISHVS